MSAKGQLINMWVDVTDLTNKSQHKLHLTVPVCLPLEIKQNVLSLLTLALLPPELLQQKPKFAIDRPAHVPIIRIEENLVTDSDKLWIYCQPVDDKIKNKAKHKCQNLLCCHLVDNKAQVQTGFNFERQLVEQLTAAVKKTVHWHILIEGEHISISTEQDYFEGYWYNNCKINEITTGEGFRKSA